MKTFRFTCLFGIFLLLVPGVLLSAPPKDTLTTTAIESMNGSTPVSVGANWVYAYELPCNSTLSDTLYVDFMISNTGDPLGQSYTIGFKQPTGDDDLIHATLPASFSLADNATPVTKDIDITTDTLAPGDYILNINVDTPPGALTEINPKDIQVKIHVNECEESVPTCFFTNSNGDFLANCDEELVSTNEGGTFMLVNKKNGVIVSTNPGQFYYNYIWTNDGAAVDVEVQLGGLVNLVPKGANAVHAYTFDTSGFTQNLEAFDMVNYDGTPCGPEGPCTINVGQGETLWVTWHLAYEGIRSSKPDAGNSCPGFEVIGATADTEVAGECSAMATGYNKR